MYIGNTVITQGFTPQVDFFSGNASTTAFTLSRPVASVYQMIVNVANVDQNPGSAYTVSGNTITFASAPPSGTNNIWVEYTSLITQVIQPSAGTVGTLQLQSNLTLSGTTTTNTITSAASTNLLLQTNNGTTAVTIDTSQNVGIGVTPPTIQTGFSNISLGYAGNFIADKSSVGGLNILQNAYRNSGGTYTYVGTAPAEYYQMYNGQHAWYIAGSGTAGNTISFTQAMTLDNSGRLGVGVVPNSGGAFGSQRLQVGATGGNSVATFYNNQDGSNSGVETLTIVNGGASATNNFVGWYTTTSITSRGTITWNGSNMVYSNTSDQRLKENIVDAGSGLAKLSGVQIKSFDFIENKAHVDFGVIAQELHNVAPEAVSVGQDNQDGTIKTPWGVDTSVLVPAMIKAIQELSAQVTALQAKVA